MFKQKLALLLVVVLVLAVPGAAVGGSADNVYDRVQFLYQQINEMETASVYSNVYIDSLWVDLNNVNSSGAVTTYLYRSGNPTPTVGNFTTAPRSLDSAIDKIVRYTLGNVANVYRQEPFNTEITMKTYQLTTIPTYVYGDYKVQALDEILLGLPDCFNITYSSGGAGGRSSIPSKEIPMPVAQATLKAIFSINEPIYTLSSGSSSETKTVKMDVAPEVIEDRTFMPVRYLAYALGVPEAGVQWDGPTQTVTIVNNESTVQMTIGSTTQTVNGESVEMDTAPYVKQIDTGGRTMLPARWVAEPLGAEVTWDQESQQMVIEVPQEQEQGD